MKKLMFIAALLLSFGISDMNAQGPWKNNNNNGPAFRQAREQRACINQGVRNGDINRRERRQLNQQQNHIWQLGKMAFADGRLTRAERKMLQNAFTRADRNIYRKRNNGR